MTPVRHIDTKDVAKLIRRDLKKAFPSMGFTVRISRYTGGSSIDRGQRATLILRQALQPQAEQNQPRAAGRPRRGRHD